MPLGFSHEVTIKIKRKKGRPKKRQKSRQQKKSLWYRKSVLIPAILIAIGLSGTVYFGWRAIRVPAPLTRNISTSAIPQRVQTESKHKSGSLPRSEPRKIRIAAIAIDTATVAVGRQADDSIAVPPPNVTGWYSQGPTPGETGPAIIVGHLDSTKGPAIFWRLSELQPGQIVEIDRADGKTAKFKIDAVKQFPQAGFPTKEVYGNTNTAQLRLITCAGTFDRATRQYSHNLVVFTSLTK